MKFIPTYIFVLLSCFSFGQNTLMKMSPLPTGRLDELRVRNGLSGDRPYEMKIESTDLDNEFVFYLQLYYWTLPHLGSRIVEHSNFNICEKQNKSLSFFTLGLLKDNISNKAFNKLLKEFNIIHNQKLTSMDFLTYQKRLNYLLECIEKEKIRSPHQAAENFDCNEKTIRNMINALREQGYDIGYCMKTKKYFLKSS